MSALITKALCLGVAVFLAFLAGTIPYGMTSTGAGPWTEKRVLEEGLNQEPAPTNQSRGDLLLAESEEITIHGNLTYRRAILGKDSLLNLEDCNLTLVGDGNEIPSIIGHPSTLSLINSSIILSGMDGSSKLRSAGSNVSVELNITSSFEMFNSSIYLRGGEGWTKSDPGAPFSTPLSGFEFSGGNSSFTLLGGISTNITIVDSEIKLYGGYGGNAPDGEDLDSDDFHLSGGYTTGANLSGWVGSGGGVSVSLKAPGASMHLSNSCIWCEGGWGGWAGNAGGVVWDGEKTYTHPTTSGGYSSGGWKAGAPYDPGTISGDVGSGGRTSLEIIVEDLTMIESRLSLGAGGGGGSGKGGSCISEKSGTPETATNTIGGGGGGSYAGGSGGYMMVIEYDGGDGGDLLYRVARGGDSEAMINCTGCIWMEDNFIECSGGFVWNQNTGGNGGGDLSLGIDGGGGGASGYSGGGGASAELLYNSMKGGTSGWIGPDVADCGDYKVKITAPMMMARGLTEKFLVLSTSSSCNNVDGKDGEVSGMVEYDGGGGGNGPERALRIGSGTYRGPLPAPFPVYPLDGEIITDLSQPFEWDPLDTGYYPASGNDFTFRLIGSMDINDVIQEFNVTSLSTFLIDEIEDGHYYWTVKPHKGNAVTTWMKPQLFTVDRTAPVVLSGPVFPWVPSSDPVCYVRYIENLTGLDPDSVMVKYGPLDGPFGEWFSANTIEDGNGIHSVEVVLPSEESNYTFYVKASDRAGNGPILAGPYFIGVDGSPPMIEDLAPDGWTNNTFHLSFRSFDRLSGLSGNFTLNIQGPFGSSVTNIVTEEYEKGLFRSIGSLKLEEGNYTFELVTRDAVDNLGTSGPLSVLVDGSSPLLVAYTPADGTIFNDPVPAPSIKVVDALSGPLMMEYHLEGPSGIFDLRYFDLLDTVDVNIGQSLSEGNYTWYANASDQVKNRMSAGPFHFMVDMTPPIVEVKRIDEGNTIMIDSNDILTGLEDAEIRCEIPGKNGWIEVWKETIDLVPGPPRSEYLLHIQNTIPGPVCYLSVRGTDQAKNMGDWSSRTRINGPDSELNVHIDLPAVIGANALLEVNMDLPLGVDTSSVSLKLRPDLGSTAVLLPRSLEVLTNSTPIQGSDLLVPSRVKGAFQIPFDEGVFEVRITFRDGLPLPIERTWGPHSLTVDGDLPLIDLEADPFYSEVPARVTFDASDRTSGISMMEISVGGGEFGPFDLPGAPSLHLNEAGSSWILVNFSYGPETEIIVRVLDEAGNIAEGSVTTRATRPPFVSIMRHSNGTVVSGEEFQLTADCQDPEGDILSYSWYVDDVPAGTGEVLSLVLENGTHRIILNCTDGDLFVQEEMIVVAEGPAIEVEEKQGPKEKGPPILLVAGIIILILVLATTSVILVLWRKGDGSDGDEEDEEDWGEDEIVKTGRTGEVLQDDSSTSKREDSGFHCGICLRRLSGSSRTAKCRCGAQFHRACASREGECPECGREIMLPTNGI